MLVYRFANKIIKRPRNNRNYKYQFPGKFQITLKEVPAVDLNEGIQTQTPMGKCLWTQLATVQYFAFTSHIIYGQVYHHVVIVIIKYQLLQSIARCIINLGLKMRLVRLVLKIQAMQQKWKYFGTGNIIVVPDWSMFSILLLTFSYWAVFDIITQNDFGIIRYSGLS